MRFLAGQGFLRKSLLLSTLLMIPGCVPVYYEVLEARTTGGSPLPLYLDISEGNKRCETELCCGAQWRYEERGFATQGVAFCVAGPARLARAGRRGALQCYEGKEPWIFQIEVKGASDLDHVTATLVTSKGTITQYPTKAIKDASGGGGGPWGGAPAFEFSFDLPCDFNEHYSLTLNGVRKDGKPLEVPPVTFDPVSIGPEWT